MEKIIDMPVGAKDSDLKGWEYTIPEGMEAVIKDGKIIVREKESRDETIRKAIIHYILYETKGTISALAEHTWVEWLEKQKTLTTEETELNSLAFLEQMGYTCVPPGKEQKPAEWSEEDDKMFEAFMHKLEVCDLLTNKEVMWAKLRLKSLRPQRHKWYIKKGHWYMCIVDKPEYGWTKGKVYQSPEDNRIETDYKGDLTNWPDSEPWFRPATREEIPDSKSHWKPSEEQEEPEYYQHFDPDC